MRKAAFLDRDGVINRKAPEGQYITRWKDFQFMPQVTEAIAILNRARFSVIVVSNQRCIAKGLLSIKELEQIHCRMLERVAAAGASIDAVYYCPHDLQPPCACRKPAPGMLFRAAKEHLIDLPSSWMVGDSDSDVRAGKNAGCKTVRILRNGATHETDADFFAVSLLQAAQKLAEIG